MKRTIVASMILVALLLASAWLVGLTSSAGVYNPWYDLDDDGDIDIFDIVKMAGSYGTKGEPLEGIAALEYDSGWLDLTSETGQNYMLVHNLDTAPTDLVVDVREREIEWNRTYGEEDGMDCATSLVQTSSGGYVLAGYTNSTKFGDSVFCLVETDRSGNEVCYWEDQSYGKDDYAYSVTQSGPYDDRYILAGETYDSLVGNATDAYLTQVWLQDNMSGEDWGYRYAYGDGLGEDSARDIVWLGSEYAVAGYTNCSLTAGGFDFLLYFCTEDGCSGGRVYGGADDDYAFSVTTDTVFGGCLLAGRTASFGAGGDDAWLVLTDPLHPIQVLWNRTYGGSGKDWAFSVIQTGDLGLAFAGCTDSYGAGKMDFWLVKTDEFGNLEWNRTYGGVENDQAYSVVQTSDGGYALAGYTASFGAGDYDFWLVKTDAGGNVEWSKTFGGPNSDLGCSVVQTNDEGYAVTGSTYSFDTGNSDFWLIKEAGPDVGLAWTDFTANSVTLCRNVANPYWNHVRVRIWKIKETP